MLSCSSHQSRNFRLGFALGEGRSLAEARAGQTGISEGMFTASAVVRIADARGIEVPISAAVLAIMDERMSVADAIDQLMQRPLKVED